MAAKSKLRKELKAPDDFISMATRAVEWMAKNRKPLLVGGSALIVVVAALWTWRHFAGRSDLRAADTFAAAMELYRRPVKGELGADDKDPKRPPFKDEKARAKAALAKLEAVLHDYPASRQARLAQLFVGNSQLTLGETDKAIASYEAFLSKGPKEATLRALAYENLGYAHERKKQYGQAIDAFSKMAAGTAFAERGLYHEGRVYELQGQTAKAKEYFQKALQQAKKSKLDWFARQIESKIALLELAP